MSNPVLYVACLGMLLYQSGCLKLSPAPMTKSAQTRHSRLIASSQGPILIGGYFISRTPTKFADHDTTTGATAKLGKYMYPLTTEKGLQDRYNTGRTVLSVITTEKQISEKMTELSHNKFATTPSWRPIPETVPPKCSPESCHARGLQTPSCSNEKCGDINRTCHCDILCVIFGDCCSDVLQTIPKQAVQRILYYPFDWKKWFHNVESVHLVSTYIEWSTCISIRNGSNPIAIRVIAKCPESDNTGDIPTNYSRVSALCEGFSHLPFVTWNVTMDNKMHHILFKNRYCARCHGFNKGNVVSVKTILNHYLGARHLQPLASGVLRRCDYTSARYYRNLQCRQDDYSRTYNLITVCSLNIFPVDLGARDPLNNLRCFYCNGTVADCDIVHFTQHEHALGTPIYNIKPQTTHGLESLFSFFNYPHVHTPSKYTTVQRHVYRNVTDYPFVQCPLGFTKTGHTCNKQSSLHNSALNITVTVESGLNTNNISGVFSMFTMDLLEFTLLESKFESYRFENIYQVSLYDQNLFRRLINAVNDVFRNTDSEIVITTFDETRKSVICQENQTSVVLFDVSLLTINDSVYVGNDKNTNLIPFPFAHFTMTLDIHKINPNKSELTLSYCSSDPAVLLNCSAVRMFPPDRFSVHNDTVRLYDENMNVPEDMYRHYTILNHTLWVCEENNASSADNSYLMTIGQYISNITMTFSIVALFLLIYYHIVIPRLLNLHGKILISFSISLAISQLINVINAVMVSAKEFIERFTIFNYICKVLGVLGHYLLICTFLWSAIMSYDICRRFGTCSSLQQQIDADKGGSRFRLYSLIATLLPFVIVLIANLVAFLSEDFALGYGDDLHCMIYTFEGKLYAFDISVISIYAFSIVCFIISLHGLEYARRAGKKLYHARRRDRQHLIAYFKITLMIGVTWLISIGGAFTRSVWVSFLGQFINGLQGLQVFIGFLFNDRIRKVIMARFCCPIRTTDDNNAVSSHIDR